MAQVISGILDRVNPLRALVGRVGVAGSVLSAAVVLSSSLGCEKPTRISLTDSELRGFVAVCKGGACSLEASAVATPTSPQPDGAEPSFVLHQASRLVAICDVWKKGSAVPTILPIDCRPIKCKADTDCPPAKGLTKGACTDGYCTEPSGAFGPEDAGLLCLAGTGIPANTSRQIERFALGSNCGSPCTVPAVCRQP